MPESTLTPTSGDRAARTTARILVIDDDESLLEMLQIVLERSGHEVIGCSDDRQALETFQRVAPDLILLDLRMGSVGGLEVLRGIKEADPAVPVIVITAYSTWDNAVQAMRLGAYDFIKKPFDDNDSIREVVSRALAQRSAGDDRQEAASEILGNSPPIRAVLDVVKRVAPTDSTVLVMGESGTGKELLARALHYCSHRRHGPFLSLNCAAFPDTLLESELFGHARGAFSGAHQDKKGLIEVCNRGTLFLDEIGEMSLGLQAKLLRALEDRRVLPVGGTVPRPLDVRFICATNRDVEEQVARGAFRADLYYRINVVPITLPPLRERKRDIPLLAAHFLAKYSRKQGKEITGVTAAVQERLMAHDWPGNVRELENTIQRAVTLAPGDVLDQDPLRPSSSRAGPAAAASEVVIPPEGMDLEGELAQLEKAYLKAALEQTGGHLTNAARLLGISFRAIRYKVRKYDL